MAERTTSILDTIANPVVANPLQALNEGTQTARNVFALRDAQAQQAIGGILQQSTGPDGTLDYNKANALASQAGPVVQMGMQKMLRENSELRGSQLTQGQALGSAIARGTMTIMNDSSDENVNQTFDNLARQFPGQAAQIEQERRAVLALPPGARSKYAYQKGIALLDAHEGMARSPFGTTTPTNVGGATVPITTTPATPWGPGTSTQGGGGVEQTPTPGERYTPQTGVQWLDKDGNPTTDPGKAVRSVPVQTPRGPAFNMPGPFPSNPNAPANTPPGRNAPPDGSPLRRPGAPTPEAPPASTQPPGTQTPPPAATTPSVPQGMPSGAEERVKQDQELYGGDTKQVPDMQRRAVAGQAALEALELARSGPGTGNWARVRAFLQAQGIDPGVGPNDYGSAAARQVLQKNLLRFAQDASSRAGTDLGLQTQLHSNANADEMLPAANRHVVIQDMGLLRQRMAMVKGQEESGVGYRERTKNFSTDTDPVAFAWDLMDPGERHAYLNKIGKSGAAYDKWAKSMKIAKDTGVWGAQPGQ